LKPAGIPFPSLPAEVTNLIVNTENGDAGRFRQGTRRALTENEAARALKFISSSSSSTSRLPLYSFLKNSATTVVEGGFPAFFDLSD